MNLNSELTPNTHERVTHAAQSQPGLHPSGEEAIAPAGDIEKHPDQPLVEVGDTIDQNLRHRMVSQMAYRRYVERGYADGGDIDDWLQAEAEVDLLLSLPAQSGGKSAT